MTDAAMKEANDAFHKQISSQVTRITSELHKLEHLLSAGMVDRRVLSEFRDAVNKVRQTSWHVECWLDGDVRDLSSLLIEERIRAMSQLTRHLISDLQTSEQKFAGLTTLRDSIQKLERMLQEQVVTT